MTDPPAESRKRSGSHTDDHAVTSPGNGDVPNKRQRVDDVNDKPSQRESNEASKHQDSTSSAAELERSNDSLPAEKRKISPPLVKTSNDSSPTEKRKRSPSPVVTRSPPRQRKRPGGASRISAAEREAAERRQAERSREVAANTQSEVQQRGVHDVVRQHYNSVQQRGRNWRKTESKIKGLRSYNNWAKSTMIQKFSISESLDPNDQYRDPRDGPGLLVLDVGCGKGGDLQKWQKAPQRVDLYIGVDPAEVSIDQARDRYREMRAKSRGRIFRGEFFAADGYGQWLGNIPLIKEVGIEADIGPGKAMSKWSAGNFDVVTMMFCMHYAFENEEKARGMLRNVAGALKKGGRFIGVIPNSDVLRQRIVKWNEQRKPASNSDKGATDDREAPAQEDGQMLAKPASEDSPEWGNSIYRVRFPPNTPRNGTFRPPWGWRYSYFMEEAVEEVPEYVVPWEAFRALAQDYNLEMQYRKSLLDIWNEEKHDRSLGPLAVRMGVTDREGGELKMTPDEREAVSFYHGFCFYKV